MDPAARYCQPISGGCGPARSDFPSCQFCSAARLLIIHKHAHGPCIMSGVHTSRPEAVRAAQVNLLLLTRGPEPHLQRLLQQAASGLCQLSAAAGPDPKQLLPRLFAKHTDPGLQLQLPLAMGGTLAEANGGVLLLNTAQLAAKGGMALAGCLRAGSVSLQPNLPEATVPISPTVWCLAQDQGELLSMRAALPEAAHLHGYCMSRPQAPTACYRPLKCRPRQGCRPGQEQRQRAAGRGGSAAGWQVRRQLPGLLRHPTRLLQRGAGGPGPVGRPAAECSAAEAAGGAGGLHRRYRRGCMAAWQLLLCLLAFGCMGSVCCP